MFYSLSLYSVQIQLDEVEVLTGEEGQEAIYVQRAKLFKYAETLLNKGTGILEWLERGVGDAKILKCPESGKLRFLMRQEKTMKVISNHVIDPRIVLTTNAGSTRSWVWVAYDFAEGDLEETTFAIRLKTDEIAQEFKTAYDAAIAEMAKLEAGEDAASSGEADEAAEALAGLSTGETKEEEAEEKAE